MCEVRDRRRWARAVTAPEPLAFPEPSEAHFASIEEVRDRLAESGYLADEGIAGVVYLADRLAKPVLVEGPAGTGKTELAKSVARSHEQPAHQAPVLRGPRRVQGALRVELQEAAAANSGSTGRRGTEGRRR